MIDTRLKLMIAIPFLLIALSFVIVDFIPFRSALTAEEHQIIGFMPEDLSIPSVKRFVPSIDSTRVCSEIFLSDRADHQSQETTPTSEPLHGKVSLIVMGDKGKMAIVDGALVREGDSIGSWIVRKIESQRVLIEPGSQKREQTQEQFQQWLYMEGVP